MSGRPAGALPESLVVRRSGKRHESSRLARVPVGGAVYGQCLEDQPAPCLSPWWWGGLGQAPRVQPAGPSRWWWVVYGQCPEVPPVAAAMRRPRLSRVAGGGSVCGGRVASPPGVVPESLVVGRLTANSGLDQPAPGLIPQIWED